MSLVIIISMLCLINGFVGKECPVEGPPLVDLGYSYDTPYVYVFISRHIPCAGWLTSWKFYAYAAGSFYASVWRPRAGTYTLIGKNRIDVQSKGVHEYHVPTSEQILVETDDVIGHHAVSSEVTRPITGRFTDTSGTPPSGFTDEMYGPVIGWAGQDNDTNAGMTVPKTASDVTGEVALLPVLQIIKRIAPDTCISGAAPPVNIGGKKAGKCDIHIYPNVSIRCSGRVSSWLFYAHSAGRFYASVWRRVASTYTLIGKNKIDVTEEGIQTFNVEVSQQIVVMAGDVISEHAVDTSTIRPLVYRSWYTQGFISGLFPDMIQSIYRWNARDDTIPVGMTISVNDDIITNHKSATVLQPIIARSLKGIYRTATEYITVSDFSDVIPTESTTCTPINTISPANLPHDRFRLLIQEDGHVPGDRCFVISVKNTLCTEHKQVKLSVPVKGNSNMFAGRRKLCKAMKTTHIADSNTCHFLCHCEQFPCAAVLQINNIHQPEVELCLVKSDFLCEEI